MNKYVVEEIYEVNQKLKAITNGNLEETVNIRSSVEFSELSEYINVMVKSLLDNNKKMSYVLSRTHLYIGVYEYNKYMKKVRFTEYIPRILSFNAEEMEQLSSDIGKFRKFIDKMSANTVPGEPGICKFGEKYVRVEEMKDDDACFGIMVDVTSGIIKRRKMEAERDIDLLTGLYNRRGLDSKLSELFDSPEKLGHSAIIMIDADGLKKINDTYGHETGDMYLKKIAELLKNVGKRSRIAARQGGDEFVLFLYGYESEEGLMKAIRTLEHMQNQSIAQLEENLNVPIRFSFGYCLASGDADYRRLFKTADEKMYQNKLERKEIQGSI